MGHRRRGREYAVQMLFQLDLTGDLPSDALPQFWVGLEAADEVREFAERLVRGTHEHRLDLDRAIAGAARNWRLERMATVDRAILRLATFELLYEADVPHAVVIDEAIDLAKTFGGGESGAFINGVLDTIVRRRERERATVEEGER